MAEMNFKKWLRQIIRQDIKYGRPGRKLKYLSTNDLDENRKLYPNFLERRRIRKAARKAKKEFICGQIGGDVY